MLLTLKRIVQEMASIPELGDGLVSLTRSLKDAMQVDCCSIYLADYNKQHFTLMATDGLSQGAVGDVRIGFSEGLIGLIGQREEPINLEDAQSHPRFKYYPQVEEESYHAFMGTPIIHQRKVLGILTVQQKRKRKFSEDEEAFLVTLSAQLALEILQAEMRGQLSRVDDENPKVRQKTLNAISASEGIAIAHGVVAGPRSRLKHQILVKSKRREAELERYKQAVRKTRDEFSELAGKMQGVVPEDAQGIFQLYQQLLDNNNLGQEVEAKVNSGWSAVSALKLVVESYVRQFVAMEDSYMRERATDIEDLGDRVLGHLLDKPQTDKTLKQDAVLVALEITASMLAEFPHDKLKGIVSMKGTQNSHGAILARAMGIPAVMGLGNLPLALFEDETLIVDGYSGQVLVAPEQEVLDDYRLLMEEEAELFAMILSQADKPATTTDGCTLDLMVNSGLEKETEFSAHEYSKGIGLYRTEIPFMLRERFPTEQEQCALYRQLLTINCERPVTMRTLDVGGDKPLPYLPIHEENPFLGWRGIRLTLDHPEIFLVQVRAMLKANLGLNNLKIMLPMISSVNEVDESIRLINQAFYEVGEEVGAQKASLCMPQIGVMLEVPSVLYQLPELASRVDFFSVGSNDLTQYMLAVDRNNSRVASICDSYHPAILRALYHIVQQSEELSIPVTLCGELAGEPGGAVLLMAMGYRQLSMSPHNLRKVKWVLRNTELKQSQLLLHKVLLYDQPQQVKDEVNIYLETMGAGGLIRAGK